MKFNLKNRPREGVDFSDAFHDIEEWFEGFEKELSQLLEDSKKFGDDYNWGQRVILQEILGVDSDKKEGAP